jgi:hypothetical protein
MTPSAQIAGGRRVRRWTCEIIIEKMAAWHALHGEPPCSADWNPSLARWRAQEWRAERYYDGEWPSTNAVKRAFGGSFDAAVRAAGFAPARPGPRRKARAARPDMPQRAPVGPREVRPATVSDAEVAALERRLAAAERRAERAEERLREARKRARLANERANRARKARERSSDEAGARVRAALDQADAAVRDAEAMRGVPGVSNINNGSSNAAGIASAAGSVVRGTGASAARAAGVRDVAVGPAGPGVLADALRRLAAARTTNDRHALRIELSAVAAEALRWRDRL